ncbi:MAG: Ldh family oxidoreductase, partial [Synergistaceae bacterium]|nr:Ldh family oxidoreductase [Synergistaceae bacterium]
AVYQIGQLEGETASSQVFIALNAQAAGGEYLKTQVEAIIDDLKKSAPDEDGSDIRYPGEGSARRRADNARNGIPVDDEIWNKILKELKD